MKYSVLLSLAALAACGQATPQTTSGPPAPVAAAQAAAPATINTPRAKELLQQPGTQVLDVRTAAEYMVGHLNRAQNLNVNAADFDQQVTQLDTSKTYVVYCGSGVRSGKAADIMHGKGFRHVVNGGGYGDLN